VRVRPDAPAVAARPDAKAAAAAAAAPSEEPRS
jgi:hypothetical protein